MQIDDEFQLFFLHSIEILVFFISDVTRKLIDDPTREKEASENLLNKSRNGSKQ